MTAGSMGRAALVALTLLLSCARTVPPPLVAPEPPAVEAEPREDTEAADGQEALPAGGVEATPEKASAGPPAEPPSRDQAASAHHGLQPIPSRVRVGLATDLESLTIPCCDQDVVAVVHGRQLAVVSNLVVEPGVAVTVPPIWRLQVAALRDEVQAGDLARRLEAASGMEAKVVFDAGTGLYRVRLGAFASREEADAGRRALAQRNIHDAWIVGEQSRVENPALRLTQGDRSWLVRGRWLAFQASTTTGISVRDRRYRGRILVYLNDRGTLNLINEVGLDDYLRGVVPREMGPEIYDEIDALKAQAIAARSYTLRNMGEFADEGYDICATPRCQVYGGMEAENPLSDRAVLETSGEVLAYGGRYADALYSSTCGGHTEDVEVVFPLKEEPYLRGVPCHESGVDRFESSVERGLPLARGLSHMLAPPAREEPSATDFAARLKMLAGAAGLAASGESLASLERREVQRFLAAQLDLNADARLLVASDDVPYLVGDAPAGWSADDLLLAAYLVRTGFFSRAPGTPETTVSGPEIDEIIFRAGAFLRVLEERRVRYLGVEPGELVVKERDGLERYSLPPNLATFSRQRGDFVSAPLALVPGDRLRLFLRNGRVLAIAQELDLDGVSYDRTSNLSSWTRFRSRDELRQLVGERYPGFELDDLAVLERGVSGRVRRLLLVGSDFTTIELAGLPIRWTLDLPDTLFTAKRLEPPGGEPGWLFSGRGWGHGVGMCQVGSYGMALRGHSYRDILHHYYSGVEIARAPSEVRAAGSGSAD